MTDESADAYATKALGWKRGSPFEVVVGLPNVPEITRAFERKGCVVAEEGRPGRLIVSRAGDEVPEGIDVLAHRQRMGARLILFVRANHLDNIAAAAALGATFGELVHLRMGRFREVGDERLTDMVKRLEE